MSVAENLDGLQEGLRSGALEIRLADSRREVEAAQALRYRVFYEEMQARPTEEIARLRRDFDAYDAHCDHLLVFDHSLGRGLGAVIGTYRMIRRPVAAKLGRFYTASEFDIGLIVNFPGQVLELGRSCVDARYRTRPVLQLLWRGIGAYVMQHDIALMFGCASLPGTDPAQLGEQLSYLYYHHLAPPALRPRALPHRYVDMRIKDPAGLDARAAFNALPPLIKGYLRVGGFIGDGAVIDEEFNTVDVCVVVKTEMVAERYFQHYLRPERDLSAV